MRRAFWLDTITRSISSARLPTFAVSGGDRDRPGGRGKDRLLFAARLHHILEAFDEDDALSLWTVYAASDNEAAF
jgi:hypothetical protein